MTADELQAFKDYLSNIDFENIEIGDIPEEFEKFADIINDEDLGRGL